MASSVTPSIKEAQMKRVPRIGDNSKNRSNDIFKFGGTLSYANDKDRYKTNVAEQERERRIKEKENKQKRVEIKRAWKDEIENARWNRLADDYCRQAEQWQRRHAATKMGRNSVNYNPITLEYHRTQSGEKLAKEYAKSL
ncbi:hypothetical protein HDU76_009171, partial [Blyttiomyces sp. JEL0837]